MGGMFTVFSFLDNMEASKVVSSAILGYDGETIFVGGKAYIVPPPTIARIASASYFLSDIKEGDNMSDIIKSLGKIENAAHALSHLVCGSDNLFKAFRKATLNEVIEGLSVAISLISAENFLKLLALAKSVAELTAKQR